MTSPAVGRSRSAPAAPTSMETSGGREAEFIGTITASATHEMRNVLAIVKESAGLIEDLVHASSRAGGAPHGDRILKATGRIDAQVARGAEIVTRLNRFAHSMDGGRERVDLAEEVREVAFLSQRLARTKCHTVVAVTPEGPVWIGGNSSARADVALRGRGVLCRRSARGRVAGAERLRGGSGSATTADVRVTAEPGTPLPRPGGIARVGAAASSARGPRHRSPGARRGRLRGPSSLRGRGVGPQGHAT